MFFKLLTASSHVRYIRIEPEVNLYCLYHNSKKFTLSRFSEDQHSFSQVLEVRIANTSSFKDMTYEHYCKQKIPICENKLNQLLSKNPNLINRFIRGSFYPMITIYPDNPLCRE